MGKKIKITETLDIDLDGEAWCCGRCGKVLTSARDHYKRGCLVYDRDPQTVYPPLTGAEWDFAPNPQWCRFLEFYCPGCGVLVETEALPPGHPITMDIELDIDGLREKYGCEAS